MFFIIIILKYLIFNWCHWVHDHSNEEGLNYYVVKHLLYFIFYILFNDQYEKIEIKSSKVKQRNCYKLLYNCYNPTISIEDRSVWYILYFCNSSYAEVQMENANRRSSKFNLPWLIENTEKSSTSSAFFQFSPFVNALCFCFNPDSLINDLFICLRSSILCCTDHGQIVKLSPGSFHQVK